MTATLLQAWVDAFRPLGLNYSFVQDPAELSAFGHGLLVTLQLCAWTIPVSLLFGVLIAAALTSNRPWLARPLQAFVEVTRNTPLNGRGRAANP